MTDASPSKSMMTDGFLSDDISDRIREMRSKCVAWFAHATNVNRLAQRIVTTRINIHTKDAFSDNRVLALLLMYRALSNFQGTILMAERGMIVEARTLARSCVESTLCLAGVKADPDFWRALLRDDLASKKVRGKLILNCAHGLNGKRVAPSR
jgi:hypothetical protein